MYYDNTYDTMIRLHGFIIILLLHEKILLFYQKIKISKSREENHH